MNLHLILINCAVDYSISELANFLTKKSVTALVHETSGAGEVLKKSLQFAVGGKYSFEADRSQPEKVGEFFKTLPDNSVAAVIVPAGTIETIQRYMKRGQNNGRVETFGDRNQYHIIEYKVECAPESAITEIQEGLKTVGTEEMYSVH